MYDSLLLPVDGSEGAAALRSHAAELARWADATVHVLFVADVAQYSAHVVETASPDVLLDRGDEVVAEAAAELDALDVACETHVVRGDPAGQIVAFADENGHDLVVMPTHGRHGLSRYLLGSVTERVVRTATVPVLSARMDPDEHLHFPYESVLVPTDGSEASVHAAEAAVELAGLLDATVDVLAVVQETSLGPDVRSRGPIAGLDSLATDAAADVVALAEERGITDATSHVEYGDAASEIVEFAAQHATDLVVMGTTGRRGVDRLLLGSVAETTVRTSPSPVLTVGRDA